MRTTSPQGDGAGPRDRAEPRPPRRPARVGRAARGRRGAAGDGPARPPHRGAVGARRRRVRAGHGRAGGLILGGRTALGAAVRHHRGRPPGGRRPRARTAARARRTGTAHGKHHRRRRTHRRRAGRRAAPSPRRPGGRMPADRGPENRAASSRSAVAELARGARPMRPCRWARSNARSRATLRLARVGAAQARHGAGPGIRSRDSCSGTQTDSPDTRRSVMDSTSFERSVDDMGERVRPQIEEARKQLGRLDGRATDLHQRAPRRLPAGRRRPRLPRGARRAAAKS